LCKLTFQSLDLFVFGVASVKRLELEYQVLSELTNGGEVIIEVIFVVGDIGLALRYGLPRSSVEDLEAGHPMNLQKLSTKLLLGGEFDVIALKLRHEHTNEFWTHSRCEKGRNPGDRGLLTV
jgi:hypothetical protein